MGLSPFILLCLALEVAGDIHHLFASSYRSPALFALEYDTNTNALTQVGNFNAHAGHPWMSFSFDKSTIYGAERDGWSSYQVLSPSELAFQSNLTLKGRCDGANFKHGTTNLLAGQRSPYNIYGAGRSPCGNVISSKVDGSFERIIQNVTYKADSRVYGMAHDPSGDYIYSADTQSNGLWAHKVDPVTGKLTAARFTAHAEADARPRRLAVHPSGNYLYVVLSKLNKVAVYSIKRNANGPQLAYTGKSFSLVPPGQENKRYRGTELALSANNDILYLTSRFRVQRRDEEDEDGEGVDDDGGEDTDQDKDQNKQARSVGNRFSIRSFGEMFARKVTSPIKRQIQWPWSRPNSANNGSTTAATVLPGYLTAIQLSVSQNGANGPGYPLGIMLQVSTSTSGGKSSAISAASWSNEHVALADSEKGLVQVWRFEALGDYPQSPPRNSGGKSQPPPNNFGPDPPLQPDPPIQPEPPLDNNRPQPIAQQAQPQWAPQSQTQPSSQPQWAPRPQAQPPAQPQWQPAPQPQQPKPNTSNSPKGSAPNNPLSQGGTLPSNQNLAHNTPPKGLPPANPLDQGEALPKFSITGRTVEKRQSIRNIRASIVAEWKAPTWAIGTGDPAAPKGQNQANDNKNGKTPGWGRGCCAHALWYD